MPQNTFDTECKQNPIKIQFNPVIGMKSKYYFLDTKRHDLGKIL